MGKIRRMSDTMSNWSISEYLSQVRWKNERPIRNEAYIPTNVEHIANIATHGLFIIPVIFMVSDLTTSAQNEMEIWVALVYSFVLIGTFYFTFRLFTTSTIFHTFSLLWHKSFIKHILHRCDRAMIYLFIAGSYTPWLCLKSYPEDAYTHNLKTAVWILAALGITYQQIFHEKYKWLETSFYIVIALTPSLSVLEMEDSKGLEELRYGGAAYLIGVIFFKLDGILPFAHAIWHLHVVIGSWLHYHAVSTYLMDKD